MHGPDDRKLDSNFDLNGTRVLKYVFLLCSECGFSFCLMFICLEVRKKWNTLRVFFYLLRNIVNTCSFYSCNPHSIAIVQNLNRLLSYGLSVLPACCTFPPISFICLCTFCLNFPHVFHRCRFQVYDHLFF